MSETLPSRTPRKEVLAPPQESLRIEFADLGASVGSNLQLFDPAFDGPEGIADDKTAIGGLIQNEHHKTERRVPYLGDIPILGYPFRGIFENKRRTELVIFITPTIVR